MIAPIANGNQNNEMAISWNNAGVDQLQAGSLTDAFVSLSIAALLAGHSSVPAHANSAIDIYRYYWVPDPGPYSNNHSIKRLSISSSSNNPNASYLCIRSIKVFVREGFMDVLDNFCPCGYVWVVWHNLANVCAIIGWKLGEVGTRFLEHSFALLRRVQVRLDAEPASQAWSRLQMVVFNNQACICHALAKTDDSIHYLRKLTETMRSYPGEGEEDWVLFMLNVFLLGRQDVAAAA